MAEEELKELIHKRGVIKANLTRFKKFLNKFLSCDADDKNKYELEDRFNNLTLCLTQYEELQNRIEYIDRNTLNQESEREAFENEYYALISETKRIIASFSSPPIATQSSSTEEKHYNNIHSQIKLPQINLPTFTGDYDQWMNFKDIFLSMIDSNKSLNNIQKFTYLRASLKGEAANIIQSLDLSADNYEVALELLISRYQNTKLITHNHVKALFEITPMHKENYSELRQVLDNFLKHVRSLKSLEHPVEQWDTLLIYLLTTKLDTTTLREWESHSGDTDSLSTLEELTSFLQKRCRILETVNKKSVAINKTKPEPQTTHNHTPRRHSSASFVATTSPTCLMCKGKHTLYTCEEFRKLAEKERFQQVKSLNLCVNCLGTGHSTSYCRSSHCRKCGKSHHTLLHISSSSATSNNKVTPQPETTQPETPSNNALTSLTTTIATHSQLQVPNILLSTAIVQVKDCNGGIALLRALLDSGSQANFITHSACKSLGVKPKSININVLGVNNSQSQLTKATELSIKSHINSFNAKLVFLLTDKITEYLPTANINQAKLKIPSNIQLADPDFHKSQEIDLLIGAEIFHELLCVGQLKLGEAPTILQKTQLGWIVSGKLPPNPIKHVTSAHAIATAQTPLNELDQRLTQFWDLEEVKQHEPYTLEETQCESHFKNTFTRLADGRFQVRLPFKENLSKLGESKQAAMKRFLNLEKRLDQNTDLRLQYNVFMQEYLQLNHMRKLPKEPSTNTKNYFLPHHAVIKEESLTTKLRVVFDGSAKSSTQLSLNEVLMKGPTIQDELISIILRFRTYNYVITADIEKMYRQVRIHDDDLPFQQILWRSSSNEPIQAYQLQTVTYGTTSAPFLSVRCLKQLAIDERVTFPKASAILETDFYVDDLITGTDTIEEAIELQSQLSELLKSGGFTLRKWRSNNPDILQAIIASEKEQSTLTIETSNNTRTLGLLWKPTTDTLEYTVPKVQCDQFTTKRRILSRIAQIYDPLGLLGPIITSAKLMMQRLWQLKLTWDESVPLNINTQWKQFEEKLGELNEISITRQIIAYKTYLKIELHGFSDSSTLAYGACIYLRTTSLNGTHESRLICSKSRVAPLKAVSLPRLELCAAHLLSKLLSKTRTSLNNIKIDETYCWTDSTIVLSWLSSPATTWKTFIANRVQDIQNLSTDINWKHVGTKDNPADFISRGMLPDQMLHTDLWWSGPHWLGKDTEHWPEQPKNVIPNDLERKKIILTTSINHDQFLCLFEKFSSFTKLQRVFAYIQRFIHNIKHTTSKRTGTLTVAELLNARNTIIKLTQLQAFQREISELAKFQRVSSHSKLKMLCPFFDKNKILRVGGRLKRANLPYDQRHPMLLPSHHVIPKLLLMDEHKRLLHAGPQAVMASFRRTYWPLSGRNMIRGITRNCITCFKVKPKISNIFMGDLPKVRVTPSRPFINCGVDYCGPLLIRFGKGPGRIKQGKCYIAIFVCLATKAVHIEPVTDLTTDAFLSALRRFTSRRGMSNNMYSDNGTNFVGANNLIQELITFLSTSKDEISAQLAKDNVNWHFLPPRSPHMGGLWEASVKSVKHHLYRIAGSTSLTFEELYTLLTQIEAILNSRPLSPLSTDPNDFDPLTPAHFLVGDSLTALPEEDVTDIPVNRLSRWQHVQQLRNHFWHRWTNEYLCELQRRQKWSTPVSNIQLNTLVLLRDDRLPPLKWKTGRVVQLFPGDDGFVRVIKVQTGNGTQKVNMTKVCVLPTEDVNV